MKSLSEYRQKLLAFPVVSIINDSSPAGFMNAIRCGASDAIARPVAAESLRSAIRHCLQLDTPYVRRRVARRRFATLKPAEHQVIALMMTGKNNKDIAACLDVGVRTVERFRSRILSKTAARSPLEVIKLHTMGYGGESPVPPPVPKEAEPVSQ